MPTRRGRGDGGIHWDETRQRWIATASLGFDPRGKRITRKASGKTKTEAKDKLKDILRDYEDGLAIAPHNYTVGDAVKSWLSFGLAGRSPNTVANYVTLAEKHVIPGLGARKLRDLSVEDVDRWLAQEAKACSTRTLRLLYSVLSRSVKHAQARDKVKRNVVLLCDVPTGRQGRPSKALTLEQAEAVLAAATGTKVHAYVVLALLTGARTEELRALTWNDVDLEGKPDATPPVPPSVCVIRSVRVGGDTKTRKSRRRLAMPLRCVEVLREQKTRLTEQRERAGARGREHGLVFASAVGTVRNARNVSRDFRAVVKSAGLVPGDWTPRELRHSFVSLLSDSGVPLENISRLVGHSGTAVTEAVYRQQIRPVLEDGATAMDEIFRDTGGDASGA